MKDYQKRVVAEKKELDKKLKKLGDFIGNWDIFRHLHLDEQKRLRKQEIFMEAYSEVLADRIAAFKETK